MAISSLQATRKLYRTRHSLIHAALEAALDRRMTVAQKQAGVQILNAIAADPKHRVTPTNEQLLALAGTQTQET